MPMHDINLFFGDGGLVTSTAGGYYIFNWILAAQSVSFTDTCPFHKVIGFRHILLRCYDETDFFAQIDVYWYYISSSRL